LTADVSSECDSRNIDDIAAAAAVVVVVVVDCFINRAAAAGA